MPGLSLGAWPFILLLLLLPIGWMALQKRRVRFPLPGIGRAAVGRSAEGDEVEAGESTSKVGSIRLRRFTVWSAWAPLWRSAALVLTVLALASPVRLVERVEERSEGVTIMLAFDISSSMLAEDFRPQNRIAVARREVTRFVEGRDGDRIGLVAFAGEALTVVPGTLDYGILYQAIENLDVGQLRDGTAIGTALATAVNRLRSIEEGSRVVVLLTDGDNNRGDIGPDDAAAAAAALGMRVYTIGVGRDGVAPVPIGRTRFGYQYADMEVTVNDELLDRIARATGGLYFRATDPEALTRIYRRIDELETAPVEEVRMVERAGVRSELLILALAALVVELLGSATRARRVFS
jgi:Ca-activated chloride channel family protein